MTAVKANEVDRLLRRLPPAINVLLFYGPDAGRVSERARRAAEEGVSDPADPFQLVRMDGDDVADRPGRLAEEVATYGLFGERRVIWIRPTARNIAAAVANCLTDAMAGTMVVVEAGDLSRTAPLRIACEQSALALALPCFGDETRDIGTIIDEMLAADDLRADPEARQVLIESLGGDRLATRSELAKLALFCRGAGTVGIADIEAVVSDVSSLSVDSIIDAAFAGDMPGMDDAWAQHQVHGINPALVLSAALRHSHALLASRAVIEEESSVDAALASWRGLHFRRKASVQRQLDRWRVSSLREVGRALFDATAQARINATLSPAIAAASLVRIAAYRSTRAPVDPRKARQSPSS